MRARPASDDLAARVHGRADWKPRADQLLDRLGITSRADEPFVGLDTAGRAALVDLVRDAARAGAAVLLATHQLETLAHADRAIVLGEGRVVHDGPPADLPREILDDDLR